MTVTPAERQRRRGLLLAQALNYYCAVCNATVGTPCHARSNEWQETAPHEYRRRQARAFLELRAWRDDAQQKMYVDAVVAARTGGAP